MKSGSSFATGMIASSVSIDAASAQWRSSSAMTTGPRIASAWISFRTDDVYRLIVSISSAATRARSSGSSRIESKWPRYAYVSDQASPNSSRQRRSSTSRTSGSSAVGPTPTAERTSSAIRWYGIARPYDRQRASTHVVLGSDAVTCARSSVRSRLLPIPGSPRIDATRPCRARTIANASRSRASWASRPIIVECTSSPRPRALTAPQRQDRRP